MEANQDRGWVKPIAADSETGQMDPIAPAKASRRSRLLGGLVLTVVIVAAIAGVVAWRGLEGDPFGSARSIPPGMDYVVSFDALALSDSERLQSFTDAFSAPMYEAGLIDEKPGDLVAAIDRALAEETDFTLTNDIVPWIGRSVSIAGTVPEFADPFGSPDEVEVSFLLSADVRDTEAARAFVEKLRVSLEDDGGLVEQIDIDGLPGYRFGDGGALFTGSLVLADDVLLVGISEDVVAGVQARATGSSMANSAPFLDTMTRLPADQMISVFVSGRVLDSMANLGSLSLYGAGAPQPIDTAGSVVSFGGSIGLVDDGLLATYVTIGAEVTATEIGPDAAVIETLPADTLGFMSIAGASDQTSLDRNTLEEMGFGADDVEAAFGVDIIAVLESLSGNFTMAATESRESSIAKASDVPVGLVAALGLTDPTPWRDVVDMVGELAAQEGLSLVTDGEVSSFSDGHQELVSYSLGDDLLVIGTGAELVAEVANGDGGGVVSGDLYRELDGAVAGEGLVVFVDIGRVVRLVPMTSDEVAVLAPLRGVGVGATLDGDATIVEALLLVDY